MSSPVIPTAEQVEAERRLRWHQQQPQATSSEFPAAIEEEAGTETAPAPATEAHRLLTVEALRGFVKRAGLLLYTSRPQLAGAPAPTLVEATLGRAESAPSVPDTAEARTLLAHLIADGSAIALNLLGAPGTTAENPDFVVSAAVFPYVFTLRGDKMWKQPPASAGAVKVSPLAANAFAMLTESGPRPPADLAAELGKGLTEAAVLRALGELWQHLRVLPVPQPNGAPTIWETATTRFTKQIKAGANAGQPTALSALISLYLGQVLLATEDEIETFLSPLAPRSRVRDALHGLIAAQQLDTVVIDGRHCLHITHELPEFGPPAIEKAAAAEGEAVARPVELAEDGSRIRKFVSKKGAPPARGRLFASARPSGERERRPFSGGRSSAGGTSSGRPRRDGADRPPSTRREDRGGAGAGQEPRPRQQRGPTQSPRERGREDTASGRAGARPRAFDASADDRRPASRTSSSSPERRGGDRPSFADRARDGGRGSGGDRPAFGRGRAGAEGGSAGRGAWQRPDRDPRAGGRGEQRPFAPGARGQGFSSGKERGDRPPGSFGRGGGERSSRNRDSNGPSDARSRPSSFSRADRSPRESGEGRAGAPFRRFDAPRGPKRPSAAGRPDEGAGTGTGERFRGSQGRPRGPRPQGDARSSDEGRPARPVISRDGVARPAGYQGSRNRFGDAGRASGGSDRAQPRSFGGRSSTAPSRPDRLGGGEKRGPSRPWSARSGTGSRRPERSQGGAPDGETGGAGRAGGPFDKFKGGNKPWGKRPPARKIRPSEDPV